MDGVCDSRIWSDCWNHGWRKCNAVCSLLGKTERILEAPERNLTSLGSFWCDRIVGISLETFVFRKNHFPCTDVDIWSLNLVTFQKETGTGALATELGHYPTFLLHHKVPRVQFTWRNRPQTFSSWPSSEQTALHLGALYYFRNGPITCNSIHCREMCIC